MKFAPAGAELAVRSGSTGAVRLPVSEARAWAALGDVNETQAVGEVLGAVGSSRGVQALSSIGGDWVRAL